MKVRFIFVAILFSLTSGFSALSAVEVRLKDIARIDGIRENQLTGFGIVVGLPGTGDSKNAITSESMKNYLKNLGLSTNLNASQTRNIASVLITADISSFAKAGDRIDVTVSSIGDAKSLEGGVLLQSPLKSAKNEVMAVASGVISFGGREERGSSSQSPGREYRFGSGVGEKKDSGQIISPKNQQKNVGIIHKGGIVEKEITGNFFSSSKFRVILGDQDFSTLNAISKLIDTSFSIKSVVISPIEIEVNVPEKSTAVAFLAELENLKVEPDNRAKVVINERTGTIVMGANVTIDEVAISRQGLSLIVAGRNKDSMNSTEQKVLMIEEATRVSDVVDALNKVGASTKDIIAILESLKKAGALHAEVYVQ
ncbi:MAG: flagellar basal body P-ring protein FlgI [Leptospira sp.]|nr:flagellar basal body P-ring protein FlgI [Leptospira sp.]